MLMGIEYTDLAIGEKPIINPLKGYAPMATETKHKMETSLVYAIVRWDEIESQKGIYNFEKFEEENNFDLWKQQGKRIILRVMCDIPDEEGTLNIPMWLYEETKDGEWYNHSYGKGYSPNYCNTVFIEAHERLISTLAQRYDDDPNVFVVQLGSLGHWGEWHVHDDLISSFPKQNIVDIYVYHYVSSFKNTLLQMRRPYPIAKEYSFGLFNDVFGYEEGTYRWLDWIMNGYFSEQSDEEMPAMPNVFKQGIIGGEIASYAPIEYYFTDGFESMMKQAKDTHMSYVGPHAPVWMKEHKDEVNALSQELGYCFVVSQIGTRKLGSKLFVSLTMNNLNNAPMAENWTIRLFVLDENHKLVSYKDLDGHLDIYFDSKKISTWLNVPSAYHLGVGIIDPITDKPSVKMMNTEEIMDYIYKLK